MTSFFDRTDGTGGALRYDSSKPRLDLLPLWMLADSYDCDDAPAGALHMLRCLAGFQRSGGRDVALLREALTPLAAQRAADVLAFGQTKYPEWNWANGMSWSRCVGSAARHLVATLDGEHFDAESGLLHTDHAACNFLFLVQYASTHPGLNDLPTNL